MDAMLMLDVITPIAVNGAFIAIVLGFLLLIVAKRGAEGRSKYKFEKWLNSPSPKSGALDALVNAISKLTRKPEKR